MKMTVLVVGGTGFIGAYVTRRLLRGGHRVVAFDASPGNLLQDLLTPEELQTVPVVVGECQSLRDLSHTIREYAVDRIVHLAALLHPACDMNPIKAIQINIEGQAAVLEAARLWDIRKVVWASSVAVFGKRDLYHTSPISNDAPPRPASLYAATKSFNEFLAEHYRRYYNVDALGLRLTLVYGPGRTRGATAFVNELIVKPALGEPARVPFSDDVVDWQYVEDVARLIERCLQVDRTLTGVFNTRFDVRSIREVGAYVQRLLPSADIVYEPGNFGIAWELDDSALQEEIGFRPEYRVERGVLETINYVRQKHGLPAVEPKPWENDDE